MVIIGLLLVAAVVALTVAVLVGNAQVVPVDIFGLRGDLAVSAVFVLGAVALAVLVLGVALMRAGAARRMRKRREVQRLRQEHQEAMDRLEAERARDERGVGEPDTGVGDERTTETTRPVEGFDHRADGYEGEHRATRDAPTEAVDLQDDPLRHRS